MEFEKILRESYSAILRCLLASLQPVGSKHYFSATDHWAINNEFSFLRSIRNGKFNTFLTKQNLKAGYSSLFVGQSTEIKSEPTRISRIVSSYLTEVHSKPSNNGKRDSSKGRTVLHFKSPYSIVIKILTDPAAPETREVARFLTKIALMEKFNANIDLSAASNEAVQNEVSFRELDQFYTTLEKYVAGRDPRGPVSVPQRFLAELFAAYGVLSARVEIENALISGNSETEGLSWQSLEEILNSESEFTRGEEIVSLPSIAELANVVFGVPIAVSGFNDLINGGLRQGAGEGTVTLLRGGAGSGKTTLSISIQRAVEALGIPTIFVSSEESPSALMARRESVLNLAQKSHSRFVSESANFEIVGTEATKLGTDQDKGIFELVQVLADRLQSKKRGPSKVGQFSRLFLIIDGINNYIHDQHRADIKKLIDLCRKTNAHVLITSSDDWAHSEGIEYFVDNYFSLTSRSVLEPMPHVERGISILKTRHQSSLVGDHFMRFQDEGDLLFTPNFSEMLKSHSKRAVLGPDRATFSKPFSLEVSGQGQSHNSQRMLDMEHYDRSVTLLYGRGSAYKTSLCLRLLASPNVKGDNADKRILVVSFLSTDSYYQNKKRTFSNYLETTLRENIARERKIRVDEVDQGHIDEKFPNWNKLELETLSFTPGMITAEEVYSAVSSRISSADIGLPKFSGVLFDGLHNVFVQFPMLEKHPELWSALINLVRRVGIKTVVTFTDFEVWGARTLTTVDYENARAKPLLVALSQSIDYGFGLVPVNQVGDDRQKLDQGDLFRRNDPSLFILSSFMAHSQASPTDYLIWDRASERIRPPL